MTKKADMTKKSQGIPATFLIVNQTNRNYSFVSTKWITSTKGQSPQVLYISSVGAQHRSFV